MHGHLTKVEHHGIGVKVKVVSLLLEDHHFSASCLFNIRGYAVSEGGILHSDILHG
jgi:hypothetical protein